MHWSVAAPFTRDPRTDRWLMPYVPGERHRFTLVPARPRPSWHDRGRRLSGLGDWAGAWGQGSEAWERSRGGVITVFPQLALVVGLRQRLGLRRKPVVAWCFNVGGLYGGPRRALARAAFAHVDRVVVHSRAEIVRYAEWLGLPPERFRFVPLQRGRIEIEEEEDTEAPFLLAMGSAHRDYETLFEAVRGTAVRTVVVAARHALQGLDVPRNVELLSGLGHTECRRLAQRARLSVVPVLNEQTASGQVTIVEAMCMGRPVVATRCAGSEDYVQHGVTGLLVAPRDAAGLRETIDGLWHDAERRAGLGRRAARFAAEHCSDAAAGAALAELLVELEDGAPAAV